MPSSACVGGVGRVAHARLEQVEEVLQARGEGHPVGLELDALGADGEVGEPLVAPEAGERGVVRHAAMQRELGCSGGLRGGRGADGGGGGAGALRRHDGARREGDKEGTNPALSNLLPCASASSFLRDEEVSQGLLLSSNKQETGRARARAGRTGLAARSSLLTWACTRLAARAGARAACSRRSTGRRPSARCTGRLGTLEQPAPQRGRRVQRRGRRPARGRAGVRRRGRRRR